MDRMRLTLNGTCFFDRATAGLCLRGGFGVCRTSANEAALGLFRLCGDVTVDGGCKRYIRAKIGYRAIRLHVGSVAVTLRKCRSVSNDDRVLI